MFHFADWSSPLKSSSAIRPMYQSILFQKLARAQCRVSKREFVFHNKTSTYYSISVIKSLLLVYLLLSLHSLTGAAEPSVNPNLNSSAGIISASTLVDRGNELYSSTDYRKAILMYEKALERQADPVIVNFNIGNCYYRLNEYGKAAAAFKKVSRYSNGNYTPALVNLASVELRMEQYGEAIATYRRALKNEPDNLGSWLYLADAYTRVRDFVGAQQALEKARALEPDDIGIIYQLAETHVALKDYEIAIELIRNAYARNPDEIDFIFYIGDLYRQLHDYEAAAAAYREGLSRRPNDVDAIYKLADALVEAKKPYLAMDVLQQAIAVKPDYTDASIFLGNLAFDSKWWDRAENAYLDALKKGNKEGLEGLRNLAYEYHMQGQTDTAIRLLQKAKELRPNDKNITEEIEAYKAQLSEKKG